MLKRTSPRTRVRSDSRQNARCPGVWPGAASTAESADDIALPEDARHGMTGTREPLPEAGHRRARVRDDPAQVARLRGFPVARPTPQGNLQPLADRRAAPLMVHVGVGQRVGGDQTLREGREELAGVEAGPRVDEQIAQQVGIQAVAWAEGDPDQVRRDDLERIRSHDLPTRIAGAERTDARQAAT